MASNFYKYKDGIQVRMTTREVKQFIMDQNNWTAEQYRKNYDIFKNKLRAYESYQKAQGAKVTQQSVVEVLYKEARSKERYGKNYKPSMKMQQIKNFKAYSITKGRKMAQQERYLTRENLKYESYIKARFGDFINKNKGAKAIETAFKEQAKQSGMPVNYVKMEKALSDYANKVHAKEDADGTIQENEAIPSGETFGSGEVVDFDVDAYL